MSRSPEIPFDPNIHQPISAEGSFADGLEQAELVDTNEVMAAFDATHGLTGPEAGDVSEPSEAPAATPEAAAAAPATPEAVDPREAARERVRVSMGSLSLGRFDRATARHEKFTAKHEKAQRKLDKTQAKLEKAAGKLKEHDSVLNSGRTGSARKIAHTPGRIYQNRRVKRLSRKAGEYRLGGKVEKYAGEVEKTRGDLNAFEQGVSLGDSVMRRTYEQQHPSTAETEGAYEAPYTLETLHESGDLHEVIKGFAERTRDPEYLKNLADALAPLYAREKKINAKDPKRAEKLEGLKEEARVTEARLAQKAILNSFDEQFDLGGMLEREGRLLSEVEDSEKFAEALSGMGGGIAAFVEADGGAADQAKEHATKHPVAQKVAAEYNTTMTEHDAEAKRLLEGIRSLVGGTVKAEDIAHLLAGKTKDTREKIEQIKIRYVEQVLYEQVSDLKATSEAYAKLKPAARRRIMGIDSSLPEDQASAIEAQRIKEIEAEISDYNRMIYLVIGGADKPPKAPGKEEPQWWKNEQARSRQKIGDAQAVLMIREREEIRRKKAAAAAAKPGAAVAAGPGA